MFTQNSIEHRRPLYTVDHSSISFSYFSSTIFLLSFFSWFGGRFLRDASPMKKGDALLFTFITYVFPSYTRLVKHAMRPIRSPGFRFGRNPDFHISLQSPLQPLGRERLTRPRERLDTRILVRNSYSKYTTERREFTSAGGPVDSSRAVKLFSSNYYRPPSNNVGI